MWGGCGQRRGGIGRGDGITFKRCDLVHHRSLCPLKKSKLKTSWKKYLTNNSNKDGIVDVETFGYKGDNFKRSHDLKMFGFEE